VSPGEDQIEVVRGHLSEQRREQLLGYWSARGALSEEAARQRLEEVVCLLVNGEGGIAGVNSVYPAAVDLISGRRFWIYRSLIETEAAEPGEAMMKAAFDALEQEFDPAGDGPIGLCVLIADEQEIAARPLALWPLSGLMYAGYQPGGVQARIRYFEGAVIGPGAGMNMGLAELEPEYRIEPFAEQDVISSDDILALWDREGVVGEPEASRRLDEVLLVAIHDSGELAGIATAYRQRNAQLRLEMWYYRAFVAEPHRMSSVAGQLANLGRAHMEDLFTSGADAAPPGAVYEIENPGLKSYFNAAVWMPNPAAFIGENERGDHVRVNWFSGAKAPGPSA